MFTEFIVKICGLKEEASLRAAIESGANAVGFMAYPKSKRFITPEALKALLKEVPCPEMLKTGVFVNPSLEEIEAYLKAGIDIIQLHGSESRAFALQAAKLAPVWKAFAPKSKKDVEEMAKYPAGRLLIDAGKSGAVKGGSGEKADWDLAAYASEALPERIILAGGLTPENVEEAIRKVKPAGVDVSSGVESAPGVKSPELIRVFVKNVCRAQF